MREVLTSVVNPNGQEVAPPIGIDDMGAFEYDPQDDG